MFVILVTVVLAIMLISGTSLDAALNLSSLQIFHQVELNLVLMLVVLVVVHQIQVLFITNLPPAQRIRLRPLTKIRVTTCGGERQATV